MPQAQAPTPDTGTSSISNDGAGGGAPPAPFYEAFQDQELKGSPSIQGFKDVEALAKGYSSLEKRLGVPADRLLTLPYDPNDKDGMRALYGRLGLPEKAEGYNLSLGDQATDADKAMLGRFAERMHEVGALPGAAQAAVQFLQEEQARSFEAATAARTEAKTKAEGELKAEWGAAYDSNVKAIGQMLGKYGTPELAAELQDGSMGNNPQLARALVRIAEATMEPGAPAGSNRDAQGADRPLSPAQAEAALTTLMADPVKSAALREKDHPMHMAVVKERSRLLALKDGIVLDG